MLKYFPFVANCSLFVSLIFALQAKKKKRERESLLITLYGPVFAGCIFMTLRHVYPM